MDKKILFLLFLVSGFAFSQTTVNLQDQCNCEVLSGTAVNSPGTTTPTGADTGDIYVNTNTGVIYFWDGNTWELTSSDDQVLQNFSFNPATNILSLDIEGGNTVNVDLSTLSNAGTDDQALSLAGSILTLEDGGSVDLTPFLDNTDDQIITAFSIDASNILTLTLENGNTRTVDLSGLVGTDDQTAAEVTYDNTASGLTATNVQSAIDEINALAGTVSLVDNGDGTYDFTDAAGNTTTITDTSISTLVDNADGTYTYTDETGATQVIDTRASSNPYDNTASGLTATNVQSAIDEINALAGTVSLVDNGDGTYDFTDAAGNTTTITDTSISTLVDNADGTYTYTDETGATQVIDTRASSNPYDNTASGLTATDVQAAIDEINALAGTVSLVDNGDGTYDFTDAAGNTTTITDTSISTLVDNADGTYTYTDETGATQVIDTRASSNPYDNTASGLTATDVQAAIDEINALAGTVSLVDNGDGTYDFTDATGNTTTITDTSISTLVDNADGTYTYTDETGATQVIDTRASSNPYDNTASGLTATDVQAAIDEINALAGTVSLVDNGDGTYDFTDAAGNTTTITDTSISTLVDNADGTYTYTDETGVTQVIDTRAASNPYDNTASGLTATDVQAAIDEINALAGTVSLVDNGDGTYDFTDAAGNTTTITDTSISTLVDNADGTYTYTDETGVTQVIDTRASSNPYDNTASGLTATDVQSAIDEINALAGTVSLVDNGDGTYDFTDAAGNTTTISDTSISTLVDNADGTYTYTDETGASQVIDTRASSNPYDNTASGLTATDVQSAIDEINALAGTVSLVDNGDGTYDFTDAAGNTTTITDTSISTLVDNADGTYTYTDETGVTQVIDTRASSNPYDNTASGLTATDVQSAIDEINALAGTVSLVDNGDGTYDFTDAAGNTTTITDTSISTLVDNGDGSFTYTDETGATTIFAETLTTLVDNADGTFTYTNEDGTAQIISKSDIIDNFDGTYVFNNNDGSPVTIDTRAISNPYDNTASGLTATDVQSAIDEINALAGTVSLVDNGDGTYDFTDAAGNTTTITDTSISTLVDNADGTYTYTDETGATQVIDTRASSNPYDNTASGLTATDVQAAIDEINALAGTVSLVDNGDGTYDFTDAAGNTTTITDTSISTLVDNADGTYTYTDETGATQVIDTRASSNPYDNTASGLTATDVQSAIDEINALAGTVSLVDNGDGTYDFTDAAGNTTTITDTSISTLVDNADGTYTYTDETGATQVIDTRASSNPYDNTASGLTATDVQAAIDEINALAGTVSLVDNGDGTYDFTDAAGNTTTITDTSISTLVDNADGTYTYTDETGATQVIDTRASSNPYDNTASGLTATDVQSAIDEINALAGTVSLVDNGDGTYDFTDAAGNTTTITDTSISTLVDNADGTYTYTDETGATQTIDTRASSNPYDNTVSGLTATDVQAAIDEINALAGTVALVDNGDGTYTFTDAAGNITTISDASISTLVNNGDATFTYTDETGTSVTIDLISADANNDIIVGSDGGLYLNVASVAVGETITNIADNGDGTFTYTNENGIPQTINKADVTDNGDGTYTFDNNDGSPVTISTIASSNPYDNTASGLTATDVQAAIDEVSAGSTDDQNLTLAANTLSIEDGNSVDLSPYLDNTDDQNISGSSLVGTNLTIGIENGASEIVDLSSLVGTDDQNISGSSLVGTNLTIGIENGASEIVDLSSLVGTDDQNLTLAANTLSIEDGNSVDLSPYLDNTDDQNLTGATLSGANILQIDIENGTSTTVDLSSLVGTDDQTAAEVTYDNTASGLTAADVQAAIDEVAAGSTDDQNISGSGLVGTNLTIGIENGASEIVDLSSLVGTDDQTAAEVTYDNTASGLTAADVQAAIDEVAAGSTDDQNLTLAANTLSIEDGNNVDLSPYLDNTDDQNISGSGLVGTNLTIGIENGASEVVDLSSLVGTDDQNISGSGLVGTNLTIGIENGASEVVDLSSLVGTDDQNLSTDNTPGNISIEDGNTLTLNVDDADADPTNEYNTGVGMNAGALEVTDAGGTLSASLISTDANNDISAGSDGALYLNVASVTISETITNIADNGDGTFTYTNENGVPQTISKSDVTDNGNGTYTFNNNDGTPVTINTTAASNPYDNTVSGLTATDVQAAIDEVASGSTDDQNLTGATLSGANILQIDIENGTSTTVDLSSLVGTDDQTAAEVTYDNTASGLTAADVQAAIDEVAAGSTDDQNISGSGLVGTNLTIGIENGASEVVDLSSLVGTDDQNLTLAANTLSIEDGNSVDLSPYLDNTDDQNLTGATLSGANILQIDIENGTSTTVDLSSLVGTDDQTAAEVTYDNTASGLTAADVQAAIDEVAAGSTDDQNISGSGLVGTNLTIGIENGASEVVDLSSLVGTDDQNIANLAIDTGTNILTVGIEDGTSQTVDLSHLDDPGTDDQTAAEVTYDNTASGLTAADVQAAIDEVAAGSTDDQNISGSGLVGTNLTIGIENGASEVVDLSSLVGTDDQNLTLAANTLSIEDGNSVDLSPYLDNTDDQNLTGASLSGANILQIDIENGTSTTVDLSSLVGTDDQTAAEVTYDNTASGLTAADVQAAIDEVAAGSTDDQNISGSGLVGTNLTIGIENGASEVVDLSSLVGTDDQNLTLAANTLSIEDGNSVDLSPYLDNTDDQNISGSGLVGTNLTIGIENGASEVVDLSSLVGTDDQNLTLAANTLSIEDGNSVDLSPYLDNTDDQNLTGASLSGANILQIDIENGTSTTVDLSSLVGTDDQTAAEVTYDNTASGLTAADVQAAIDEVAAGSTDDQNISGSGLVGTNLTIGIENGASEVVDLSSLVGTDDQNLTLAANTLSIEDGNSVDLSPYLDNTDDQNISGSGLVGTNLTIGIENGASEVVDLSSLVGTDDQNISGSGLVGTNLTIGIENGASEVVDLSSLVGTDDQNLTLAANTLSIEDGNSVDLSPYLDNTDDQNLTGATLSGANILQIDIENGTSTTVDLSSLVGTDDQTAAEVTYDNTASGLTAADVQAAIDEVAAGSTDDQNLTLAANTLSIEDGNSVDLSPYLDNTDDQNISGSGLVGTNLTIGIENGASEVVDLSSLVGTDDQNISGSGLVGTNLTIGIENGASEVVDLSSLVGTDDQNLTGASLSGANILQIDIENGTSTTVDLSSLVGTDDQTAAEVTYDNTASGLTAADVQAAIDEVAAGSTDDQNISGSGLVGTNLTIGIENGASEVVDLSSLVGTDDQNISGSGLVGTNLTIGIENGASEVVDLSSLVGTDDQNLTLAANTLSIEDGNSVDLSPYLDNTDDQNLTGASLNGANILQIDIENGTSTTVDLSSLVGTDDQTAAEVTYDNTASGLTAADVQAAIDEVAAGSTDDQNISGSGLVGTNLTIGIENGASEVVDLSSLVGTDDQNLTLAANTLSIEDGNSVDLSPYLDNTDDQNLTGASLSGANILQIDIENGTSTTVDLSSLVGTDDQTAAEVTYDNTASGLTAADVQAAIDEVAAGSTDDQNISGSGLVGTNLTIGIENGASEVVDLSSLVGTDDQNLTLAANTLSIEDGNSVDLSPYLDNTDDQNISGSGLVGTNLTIGIENGASEVVDLSSLVGTDDQNLTLAANTLSIEDGNSVDLSPYLDNTDDQNLTGASLSGANILQIDIENGTSTTVDLSSLVGTDDQTAAEVTYDNTASGLTAADVQAAIDEVAAGSTDDQNISGSGLVGTNLTIGIENGASEVVDLSSLVGTDDQNIANLAIDTGTNILTVGIEDGTSQTVDLSHLDDPGTDDQTAAEVTYDNTASGLTAADVQAAIDEVAAGSTDDQYDDEVPLRTPIDVDEGGEASPTAETTVQEVINAIAPITSKAARIFYPPSIAIDASANGVGFTEDLYAQYIAQFGTPAVASTGAPAALPTYAASELYYYVTYADPTVFANMSIDANGVLTYDIIGQPTDYNSLINVVFVVK